MAFTISHAVLAPIMAKLVKQHLPLAALVIGCMAPDLYRLFTTKHYFEPHQWDSIFSVTLWIGMFFCIVWYGLYRPVLYRFLGLEDDLKLHNLSQYLHFILMTMVAIILGICTHLVWDGLTHVDFRTFAFHDFLAQNIMLFGQNYPMHRILQIGSSALALPFIVWMTWHYYQQHRQMISISKAIKRWGWLILFFSAIVGVFSFLDYIRHIPSQYYQMGLYQLTGRSINEFSQGFLITFSLGCVLFLFLDRGRRLG